MHFQKSTYYWPRGSHFFTFTIVTRLDGKGNMFTYISKQVIYGTIVFIAVWFTEVAPSSSPSFGDGLVSGHQIDRDKKGKFHAF